MTLEEYKLHIGKRFGRLVIKDVYYKEMKSGGKKVYGMCECDCGNHKEIIVYDILKGATTSCRCLANELTVTRATTHGLTDSNLYSKFKNMKHRCYNPKDSHYAIYGGKGIKICDEWLNDVLMILKMQ